MAGKELRIIPFYAKGNAINHLCQLQLSAEDLMSQRLTFNETTADRLLESTRYKMTAAVNQALPIKNSFHFNKLNAELMFNIVQVKRSLNTLSTEAAVDLNSLKKS